MKKLKISMRNFHITINKGLIVRHTPIMEMLVNLDWHGASRDLYQGVKLPPNTKGYLESPKEWIAKNGQTFGYQPATEELIIEFYEAVKQHITMLQQWINQNRPTVLEDGVYRVSCTHNFGKRVISVVNDCE